MPKSKNASSKTRSNSAEMLLRLNEVYSNGVEPAEKRVLKAIKAKGLRVVKDTW